MPLTNRLSYPGSSKNLNSIARPMISEHSTHSTLAPGNPCVSRRRATLPVGLINSTPLLVGFRTWLWQYTCLLLLISMLLHRQVIFKSKGDKLSSSAGCRIRTHGVWNRSECPRTKRLNYQAQGWSDANFSDWFRMISCTKKWFSMVY